MRLGENLIKAKINLEQVKRLGIPKNRSGEVTVILARVNGASYRDHDVLLSVDWDNVTILNLGSTDDAVVIFENLPSIFANA